MREATTHNHGEIQRYLQKQMSPAEMHDFEKALMDDPFLADAIEGYAASNKIVSQTHLKEIENAINGQQEKTKVVAMASPKQSWWKVASIALIILSAGVVAYFIVNENPGSTNVAQNKVSVETQNTGKEQDSFKGSDQPVASLTTSPQEASKQSSPSSAIIAERSQDAVTQPFSTHDSKQQADAISAEEKTSQPMVAAEATLQKDEAVISKSVPAHAKAVNDFTGRVLDQAGEPVANATVYDKKKNVGTNTDAEGKFILKSADSVLKVDVSSAGYGSANAMLASNKPANNITLRENEASLSEVVVASNLRSKKAKAAKETIANNAEPKGGWQNFNAYLNNKVDSIKAVDNSYKQDVVLEFSIDNNGLPQNIKPQNKVDKPTGEKAKQILLNGPKWTNNSSRQKVIVTVPANGQ